MVASRTRPDAAGRTVDVITRADIEQSPARTLAELLGTRLAVDAYTRSAAQADLALRGSTADQVVILVDGIRMTDAQSAHYALDVGVPLDAIERIEILRGAGSALYGPNAVGGVVNIVTRTAAGAARHAAVSARAGSFGTVGAAASAVGAARGTGLTSAVQFDRSDGQRDDTDYRIGQGWLEATHALGDGALATSASVGVRDFGAADFYSPYNSSERTGVAAGMARWSGPLHAWTLSSSVSTRLHTDRFTLVRDDPSLYENRHRSWQANGALVARTEPWRGAALALGTDAEHDQLSSARLGGRREWRAAAFGELSLPLTSRAQLTTGVRDDHSSVYGDFFSPSVAAELRASDELTLRASGARGFRAPSWTDRYYSDPSNVGNASLRPERFWNEELGAHLVPAALRSDAVALDVASFARQADDLIDWVRPAGRTDVPWHSTNVGTATTYGVETELSGTIADVALHAGFAGLRFTDRGAAALQGKYALRPITRQIAAGATLPVGPGALTIDAMHARRNAEAGYTNVDARLGWPVGAVRLELDGTNLTDASWLDASGAVAQRRALYAGISWRR